MKSIMDKKPTKSTKFGLHEMNKHTLHYKLLLTTQQNTNIPYNWPAFVAVNNEYISLYALIRIRMLLRVT